MTINLRNNWTTQDERTRQAVEKAKPLLDCRLKAVKEASQNDIDRVLTSFFAYGENEYQIILDKVPEADRALLSACRDSLMGEVLQRTSGRNGYKLKEKWRNVYECRNCDLVPTHKPVTTTYRSIITDGSHNEIPLDQILALDYTKTGYIRIINPYLQTKFLLGEAEMPSLRYQNLEGVDCEPVWGGTALDPDYVDTTKNATLFPVWEAIRDKVIFDNSLSMAAYRNDTILCHNVDQAVFALNIASTRITGKTGFSYLVEFKDVYGRKGMNWGGRL